MSAGAQLTAMASRNRDIIKPGSNLANAARPLADPKRALGKYEEQWNYPGPNSKMAVPNGAIAIPQIVFPATSATAMIFSYEVPEGYRLVLTDILLNAFGADWNPGSGQLLFTLVVKYASGPRNVEFLQNLPFGLGTSERPWPLRGRLEFNSRDVLQPMVLNSGIATPSPASFAYAALNGFTYPSSESA